MTLQNSYISCGIRELTGLTKPAKTLIKQVFTARGKPQMFDDFIQILFSDNVDYGPDQIRTVSGGVRLATLIKKEKLGKVMVTAPRKNPNSGHNIQTWIWSVNWTKVKDFLA